MSKLVIVALFSLLIPVFVQIVFAGRIFVSYVSDTLAINTGNAYGI